MAIRFGVVGTGYWAREVHIPGLLATANVEVVGLWGRTQAAAETIAQRYGIGTFARISDLLGAVDALSIAVHPPAQPAIAVAAAEAGKHLILEKPVAMDAAAARAVLAAVARADVATMVCFLRRFVPEIATAIAAERDHAWKHVEVRVHSAAMVADGPYRNSAWRQRPGAALWDIGPHVLSLLIPMLGGVTNIEAAVTHNDVMTVRTWHERGATADVSLTLHSAPPDVANSYLFRSDARELVLPTPQYSRSHAFSQVATQLVESIMFGRRDAECDIRLGTEIVALLARAERHIATRP